MATLPSPRTWTSGETPTASMLTKELRTNYEFFMNPPRVKVYNSTGQSVSNATAGAHDPVLLIWDQEFYDSDAMHSGSSSQLVAVTAGIYEVVLHIEWEPLNGSNPGVRLAFVKKNASGSAAVSAAGQAAMVGFDHDQPAPSSTLPQTNHICTQVALAANDYVEAIALNTTTTARQTIASGGAQRTFFGMRWIGQN